MQTDKTTPVPQPVSANMVREATGRQRAFFDSGKTREIAFRLDALRRFRQRILAHEHDLYQALREDLHKSSAESYMSEMSIVLSEIKLHLGKLRGWARPERVRTPLFLWPSRSRIMRQPLGVALVIAPWNYPFQLLLNPLVGAISAGCCTVLKPSPYVPGVNRVIARIIAESFDPGHVALLEGGHEVNQWLLAERFDHIFFTGSPSLGKVVMEAASKNLTPVTLELGGKSPCIVDRGANLEVAARRIVWGKLLNSGQTCIAPDYLLVHSSVKDELIKHIAGRIRCCFGDDPKESPDYPRIINDKAMDRLIHTLETSGGEILLGGQTDPAQRYFAPTLVGGPAPDSTLMTDEIFGPILPVTTFDRIDEAIARIDAKPRPLALYYFGPEKTARQVLERTISGGACINDTLVHIANHRLPFGGVGNSGMGRYHGRLSFELFSNPRAVVCSSTRIDIPVRYAPYRNIKLLKKFM